MSGQVERKRKWLVKCSIKSDKHFNQDTDWPRKLVQETEARDVDDEDGNEEE